MKEQLTWRGINYADFAVKQLSPSTPFELLFDVIPLVYESLNEIRCTPISKSSLTLTLN